MTIQCLSLQRQFSKCVAFKMQGLKSFETSLKACGIILSHYLNKSCFASNSCSYSYLKFLLHSRQLHVSLFQRMRSMKEEFRKNEAFPEIILGRSAYQTAVVWLIVMRECPCPSYSDLTVWQVHSPAHLEKLWLCGVNIHLGYWSERDDK